MKCSEETPSGSHEEALPKECDDLYFTFHNNKDTVEPVIRPQFSYFYSGPEKTPYVLK